MFARPFFAVAAASLAVLPVAAGGSAQAQALDTASVLVRVGDLDLGNAKDMKRLDTRLKSAARSVCDSGSGIRDIQVLRDDAECRAHALTGARTEVAALTRSVVGGRTEVALRR